MRTVSCPHCGSPALLDGRRWECGWCGDFGDISSLGAAQMAELVPVSAATISELEQGVFDILKGMEAFYGDGERARAPAWELAVHAISKALIPPQNRTSRNLALLRTFFRQYPVCTAGAVLCAAQQGTPALDEKYAFSREKMGTFWLEALRRMPGCAPLQDWPNWLCRLMDGLSRVEAVFTGEEQEMLLEQFRQRWESSRDAETAVK